MAYVYLVWTIEKKIVFNELPETAEVQFSNARKGPVEFLEDWADGVFTLATKAFRSIPELHMYQKEVCFKYSPHQYRRTAEGGKQIMLIVNIRWAAWNGVLRR